MAFVSAILVTLLLNCFYECILENTGTKLDDDPYFDYPHMHDPHDLYTPDYKEELPNEPYDTMKYYIDTLPDDIHDGAPSSLDDTIWNPFPSKEQPEEIEEELNSMVDRSAADRRTANMEIESLRKLFDTEDGRSSISSMLLTRKTMEKLTSITKGEVANASSNPTAVDSNKENTESEKGA